MSSAHKLSLSVQFVTSAQNLPTRHQFRRWIQSALQRDVLIVLRIVDEAEGRELNKNFRKKDYATNVLTFVYDDAEPIPIPQKTLSGGLTGSSHNKEGLGRVDWQPLHGDIVICAPVVQREAREQQKELHAHYAHLAIHAALHLQGYDHENKKDAVAMETRETAIMMKLGYANPYLL